MLNWKISALLLTLGFLAATCLAASPKESEPAPAFAAKSLAGQQIDSAGLKGKVVILHFWATWCPPCREEMPALDKFYREHRAEGLEVVAVSIEESADLAKVREAAKAYSFPSAMLADARVDGFGRIWALPLTFLIDRHGILRRADWTGGEKIDSASLDRLVLPLLREQ
jgi:thiol-disulfide isomerase/thioredoxin